MKSSHPFLRSQFGSIAKRLTADFESASSVPNSTVKGTLRETFVKRFLRKYIPRRFDIASGQVASSDGEFSNQLDIIVFDGWSTPTLLAEDDITVIPIESVYAVVEVKSLLTDEELRKSVDLCKKVRSMKGRFRSQNPGAPRQVYPDIATVLFAHRSALTMESLEERVQKVFADVPKRLQLGAIYVLGGGILSVNSFDGCLPFSMEKPDNPCWVCMPEELGEGYADWHSLMWLYLDLIDFLNIEARNRLIPQFDSYGS